MRRLTPRQRLAAGILAVLAACFITLDAAGGSLSGAHGGAQGALGSLYRGTDSLLGPARRFLVGLPHAGSSRSEIEQLQRRNADLQSQLDARQTDATTVAHLDQLQLQADALHQRILPARITAFGPGQGFDWTITLGVGAHDGVAVDQTVTDGTSLVGRVLKVSGDSAVVLLAADPGFGVGVRDLRSQQLAVATGSGVDGFALRPLDPSADLKVGDTLQTGPAGQSTFQAGLRVGTISAVHVGADGGVTATVKPQLSVTALDVVGIVLTGSPATATPSPGQTQALAPK